MVMNTTVVNTEEKRTGEHGVVVYSIWCGSVHMMKKTVL